MYGHGSAKKRKDESQYVYKFYRCENRDPPPRGTNCTMKSVSQVQVEEAVWREMLSIAQNSEKLALLLKEEDENMDTSLEKVKPKLENFPKLLNEKTGEEERLVTAYRQGVISLEELEKQKKMLTNEKTNLVRQVNQLEDEMKTLLFEKGKTKTLKQYVQEIWTKIKDFTTEELFELYHICIESIILHYDEKKGQHSIDINFAIPLLSHERTNLNSGGTFGNLGSGNIQSLQRDGPYA